MLSVAKRLSEPRFALLFILSLTLWRVGTLAFDETELWVDEAQYWLWGQHLDWGYFSKPPLIAFWLRAVTDLAGSDSAFWIRVSGAFLHAVTAGLIGLSAARLFDRTTGAVAAILYASLPMVAFGSWLFSTDTLLLPCFALAFYAYLRMTDQPAIGWALTCGVALGLGFLSKYAVIYFPISLVTAALLIPAARIAWRDAGVTFGVMLCVAAPNIWWNIANGGTTLRHVAEDNAQVGATGLNPAGAWEFLASQFAVFGPIPFAALLVGAGLFVLRRAPAGSGLLLAFSLVVIALMTFQGLRAEANANWAVTGYVAGTVLVAALLSRTPRLLVLGLAVNMIVSIALPLAYMAGDTLRLPNGRLVADRYQGMDKMSLAIRAAADKAGVDVIVAERRGILADLFHRFHGDTEITLHAPNSGGAPHNYYEQVFPLPIETTGDVLFAAIGAAPCEEAIAIDDLTPEDGHYRGETYTFWHLPAACLRP
ncbi:MAG: glycosyltransferase family 39 protein [Pseudomonadota bacterium]